MLDAAGTAQTPCRHRRNAVPTLQSLWTTTMPTATISRGMVATSSDDTTAHFVVFAEVRCAVSWTTFKFSAGKRPSPICAISPSKHRIVFGKYALHAPQLAVKPVAKE